MKKIISMISAAAFVFGMSGCRDAASLEGLEDQTKEEGAQIGETEESKALEAFLTEEGTYDYNWATDYAAGDNVYTVLFDFRADGSVASDSPSSSSDTNLGLFRVGESEDGSLQIRFDGAVMLDDEMIDEQFRETQLIVEDYDEQAGTVNCTGVRTGNPVVLTRAGEDDIQSLGTKVVWSAFIQNGADSGVLRDSEGKFVARYALDRASVSIELTWIDSEGTRDARHEIKAVTPVNNTDTYVMKWEPVTVNGQQCSSITYSTASGTAAFDVSDWTVDEHISAIPDFVNGASKHYWLGGKSEAGEAHPDLWSVLVNENFKDIYFYPYADDIPLQVRAYMDASHSSYANYLFVNDYYSDPKSPRTDTDGDWIRFYASQQGDFTKRATGEDSQLYSLTQMATDLKAFTDFYFHEDGLYVIPDSDGNIFLISASTKLWVKVSIREVSDVPVDPSDNPLETMIAGGMKAFGTFYENGTKNFKLHYSFNAEESTADLIWIENEDTYQDGNYEDMAMSKAQYRTVGVSADAATGKITFDETVSFGGATFNGMTWTSGTTPSPDVTGMDCTIRTPMSDGGSNPLEYFFTYQYVSKYEGGNPMFLEHTRFCLPTTGDGISGLTGTDWYIFYPYTQSDGMPAGPMSIEIFPVGASNTNNPQSVTIKSWTNGQETHVYVVPVTGYRVENDRMIFTRGTASGELVDKDGNVMSLDECAEIFAPLERLLFGESGFHVYKAESVDYDLNNGTPRHYFYLISPDPEYPYWIKVREG